MNNWKKNNPKFEFDKATPEIRNSSTWQGHFDFAYDLVQYMKPKIIVELGSHMGGSFFAMCQGVKDAQLDTTCYAIDTWEGDHHSGFYDKQIHWVIDQVSKSYYPNQAKLIHATFDEAISQFEDNTIDLLHIDGYHTYQAVTHDYNTWLPKLAPNGIILFHDIAEKQRDFGVWKFWEKVTAQFPHFEFHHSSGLGILFPKGVSENFKPILEKKSEIEALYNPKCNFQKVEKEVLEGKKLYYLEVGQDLYLHYHQSDKKLLELEFDPLDGHYDISHIFHAHIMTLDAPPKGKTYHTIVIPDYLNILEKSEVFQLIDDLLALTNHRILIRIGEKQTYSLGLPDFQTYDITYFPLSNNQQLFKIYKQDKTECLSQNLPQSSIRPLTILYIMPHRNLTGGMKLLYQQAKYLQQQGHRIQILLKERHEALPDWLTDFMPDEEITLIEGQTMKEVALTSGCDIIFSGWYMFNADLENDEIPVFYWEQGHENLFGDGMQNEYNENWLRNYLKEQYTKNVYLGCNSNYVKQVIKTKFNRHAHVIPCSIDTKEWYPLSQPITLEMPIVLLIGNPYLKFKGFEQALETLEKIWQEGTHFKVHWLCQAPPQLTKTYPFEIQLFINRSQTELPTIYRHANILLTCSTYEGFSMPTLEAMASGVPVVATSMGGISHFSIHGENIMIAQTNKTEELAAHLKTVLTNQELRTQLIQNGLKTAQQLDITKIGKQLEETLVSIVDHHKDKRIKKKEKYAISVIIPTFKGEQYIRRIIDAVINQTFTDFEIIVINDGSPDQTQQILDDYTKKYPKFKSITQENQGIIRAKTRGLEESKGDYLLYLDHDDWLQPDALEKLYLKATNESADMVYFGFYEEKEKQKLQYLPRKNEAYFKMNYYPLWSKLIKADYLKKVKYQELPSITYVEDCIVSILLGIYNPRISILNETLYHFIQPETSTMRNLKESYCDDFITSYVYLVNRFIEEGIYEQYQAPLELYLHDAKNHIEHHGSENMKNKITSFTHFLKNAKTGLQPKDDQIKTIEKTSNVPFISVCIPVYKTEPFLRRCLDSVVNQTFRDFEVIIVNDGSPDNSQLIIDEYVNKYPYFRAYSQENSGTLSAREKAFSNACGKYLFSLDSDDWISSEALALLSEKALIEDADIIYYDLLRYENENSQSIWQHNPKMVGICTKMVKKEFLNKIDLSKLPKITSCDDWLINHLLLLKKPATSYVPHALYYYFANPNSASYTLRDNQVMDVKFAYSLVTQKFKKLGIYEDKKQELFDWHHDVKWWADKSKNDNPIGYHSLMAFFKEIEAGNDITANFLNASDETQIMINYHIATIGNWEEIVNESLITLKESGLLQVAKKMYVTVVGQHFQKVLDIFSKLNLLESHIIINDCGDETNFEFPGIENVRRIALDYPHSKILYFHTKGASHIHHQAHMKNWRQYMEHYNITRWEHCIEKLNSYDICGVDFKKAGETAVGPHFSGNFWWANAQYIRKCKFEKNSRFDCEKFIGTGKPNFYCFDYPNVDWYATYHDWRNKI